MSIQKSLASLGNFYTALIQGNQESIPVCSLASVEIPTEGLSKATLDKQSDGTLRFMTTNRCGFSEFRIFNNEARLDAFLSKNETVDIWEIQDKRQGKPKTLYKYYDGEEEITLTSKGELYEEIAAGTDHGIFSINDSYTQQAIYIQQKKGWFLCGCEEITLEQAQKSLLARETAQSRWRTIAALGIAVLAATPIVVGIGRILSKNVRDLANEEIDLPFNSLMQRSLQKTATLFSAALLACEIKGVAETRCPRL